MGFSYGPGGALVAFAVAVRLVVVLVGVVVALLLYLHLNFCFQFQIDLHLYFHFHFHFFSLIFAILFPFPSSIEVDFIVSGTLANKQQLCNNLLTHLGPDISTQTHGCLPFTTPDVFPLAATYCVSHHRGAEHRFTESDTSALFFRVVDFFNVPLIPDAHSNSPGGGLTEKVRLYLVIYPLDKAKGIKGIWTDPGVGISTRLAEVLLPLVDNSEDPEQGSQEQFKVLEWSATASDFLPGSTTTTGPLTEKDVPPPTHLPESSAHEKLRERIVTLCQRLPRDPEIANRLTPNDVFLYTTGMAAVFRLQEALFKMGRKGPVVALGAVFHSTFHLFEELEGEAERSEDLNAEKGTEPKPTVGERTVEGGGQKVEGAKKEKVEGFKHFGNCEDSDKVMDELEEYCKGLRQKGQKVAYLFVEFPSNPLLVSVDLGRLRKIVSISPVTPCVDVVEVEVEVVQEVGNSEEEGEWG